MDFDCHDFGPIPLESDKKGRHQEQGKLIDDFAYALTRGAGRMQAGVIQTQPCGSMLAV